MIFFGEIDERIYVDPKDFAFLNWHFDEGNDINSGNNTLQQISDNYEMGKAYLGSAMATLFILVKTCNMIDSMSVQYTTLFMQKI